MLNCGDNGACAKLEVPQRNHYFYGELLDETKLRREQGYLNEKRWMLNRLGLGKGVLCGLTVTWTQDLVCISPGVAIDGCGREIVVPEAIVTVDPWQTTDDSGRPTARLATAGAHYVSLCLAYLECPTDFAPVLVTDCDTSNRTAPSTIMEKYAVLVREIKEGTPEPLPDALDSDLCAALAEADPESKRKGVCGVLSSRPCADDKSKACVTIVSKVTLTEGRITEVDVCSARPVVYSNPELFEMLLCRAGGGGAGEPGPMGPAGPGIDAVTVTKLECDAEPWATLAPDTSHPPNQILQLGIPRGCDGKPGDGLDDTLTKVEKINWKHDDALEWAAFLRDGLQIDFSDEIFAKPAIDPGWMLVSLELSGGGRRTPTNLLTQLLALMFEFVWPIGGRLVYRVEGQISVHNDAGVRRYHAQFLPPPQVAILIGLVQLLFVNDFKVLGRVVVKCDFLVDKNGKAIDGNHLKGLLPFSGDRVAGGEFESWFELIHLNQAGVPGIPAPGSSATRRSRAARTRAELHALEQVFPGIGDLAKFFKIGD